MLWEVQLLFYYFYLLLILLKLEVQHLDQFIENYFGFYLLIFLGPQGSVGKLVSYLGGPSLIFSFTGLVIGSIVYSMPFVIQPLQHAFSVIDKRADEPLQQLASRD